MDAESLSNLPDVLRCDLCETPVPLLFCGPCRKNLCKVCAGDHILDKSSNDHYVVRIRQKWIPNYPECSKHSNKLCEIHCEPCKINICAHCVISNDHQQHTFLDIMESFETKRKELQDELQELEESILPTYQNLASEITDQTTDVHKNAEDLVKALNKQRDIWYREIDTIIENLKSKANDMVAGYLTKLDRQKDEVNGKIVKTSQSIQDLQKIVASSDIRNISKFKSRTKPLSAQSCITKVLSRAYQHRKTLSTFWICERVLEIYRKTHPEPTTDCTSVNLICLHVYTYMYM